MKSIFTQTSVHSISGATYPICLNNLPESIRKHTNWNYSCVQTDRGCFLKPAFHDMPYRNSFVPEIDIVVSRSDVQTILCISGQPVKFVRIFMAIVFSFLLMMEVVLLALTITSDLDNLFPVFIPIIICAFGYLLCRIATGATFKSVVKAIQKELNNL